MPATSNHMTTLLHDYLAGVKTGVYHAVFFVRHILGEVESTLSKPFQVVSSSLNQQHGNTSKRGSNTKKVKQQVSNKENSDAPSLQVIGVGFGRTGTVSIIQMRLFLFLWMVIMCFIYSWYFPIVFSQVGTWSTGLSNPSHPTLVWNAWNIRYVGR